MLGHMQEASFTDAGVAALEILGVGDIADRLGVAPHTVTMRNHRTRHGMSGGWEFPLPHGTIGSCSVWLGTVELYEAIEQHRVSR